MRKCNSTENERTTVQMQMSFSHHVLIPVRPVLALDLVPALQPLVGDGVPVDGGVVHRPGALPRHHDGCVVLGIRLNVFRLRTAD